MEHDTMSSIQRVAKKVNLGGFTLVDMAGDAGTATHKYRLDEPFPLPLPAAVVEVDAGSAVDVDHA